MSRRWITFLLIVVVVVASGIVFLNRWDRSAESTLDAAIDAHGGVGSISQMMRANIRYRMKSWKGDEVSVEAELQEAYELPRRYRRRGSETFQGKSFQLDESVTDGNGWSKGGDGTVHTLEGRPRQMDLPWYATLLYFVDMRENSMLTPLGRTTVDGREFVGIGSLRAGKDQHWFFDSKTHLLGRASKRMYDADLRKETDIEIEFSDYKIVSGVQYPHRVRSSAIGGQSSEFVVESIEFVRSMPDSIFERPDH
jgi:hypothetical protein